MEVSDQLMLQPLYSWYLIGGREGPRGSLDIMEKSVLHLQEILVKKH